MKQSLLFAVIMFISVQASAQIEWTHNDFDAGILLQREYDGSYEKQIPDDQGGFWLFYKQSYFIGNGSDTIFIQHIDKNGQWLFSPSDSRYKIKTKLYEVYEVIKDGSGGVIIFFTSHNSVRAASDLYAQRISLTGQVLWGTNGKVICDVNNILKYKIDCIAPLYSNGNYYVSWTAQENISGNTFLVRSQRLDGAGNIMWQPQGISASDRGWGLVDSLTNTRMAEDGSGGFALLYEAADTLFWQQFNPQGVKKFSGTFYINLFKKNVVQNLTKLIYSSNAWYFAFSDARYGNSFEGDIFLHKIYSIPEGLIIPWDADSGKAICKYPGSQYSPRLTSDGQNGLIISWIDNRNIMQQGKPQVFAQRWATSDNYLWNNNGVQVSSNYFSPVIAFTDPIPHRNGIVFPMWESEIGISAQKMNMLGSLQWYSPLGKIHSAKNIMLMNSAPQGNENTIIVYRDYFDKSVRVKLLDKFGYLGDNAPRINDVKDIINDQGGKLSVLFNASWQEANPPSGQFSNNFLYRIYRGISARNLPEGAVVHTPEMESGSLKGALIDLSTTTSSGESIFWEQVSEVAPLGVNGYSKVVSSTTDSGRQGIPWNYFMTSYGNFSNFPQIVWYSNIDSGYSVDNLPPYPPQIPAGAFTGGSVRLHWKKNLEEDLAGYEVYRSTSPSIVSDEQNLIAAVGDTLYQDGTVLSNTNYYYIIKAVDIHGNKSGNSSLVSLNVLSVSGNSNALPTEYALDQNYPNPFNPATNISFALPAASFVSLRVFDALGREVESLVNEFRSAGRYTVPFGGGQLSSGLYICEVRTEQFTKRIKMNLIK
jgi:hypothetical protein